MTYQEWIDSYVAERRGVVLGLCKKACAEMRKAFPELTEVKGHVHCIWGKRGHVWLTTPDGKIVDPTATQFPGIMHYEPWKPGDEVRVGKCMNCGDDIWRPVNTLETAPENPCVCSDRCEHELHDYYNGARL